MRSSASASNTGEFCRRAKIAATTRTGDSQAHFPLPIYLSTERAARLMASERAGASPYSSTLSCLENSPVRSRLSTSLPSGYPRILSNEADSRCCSVGLANSSRKAWDRYGGSVSWPIQTSAAPVATDLLLEA